MTAALTSCSVGRWIGPLAGMGRHKSPLHQGAPGRLTARDNSVRKIVIALVVIGLVWIGYMAWPLYELTALVRAIDARDVSTVARFVNFDRVRASLTEQIASAYMRMSGAKPGLVVEQAVVVGLPAASC